MRRPDALEVIQPNELGEASAAQGEAIVEQGFSDAIQQDWMTPGRQLALVLSAYPDVSLVAERFDADANALYVVLTRDPEELLEVVYSAEGDLYRTFEGTRFTLRVLTRPPEAARQGILRGAVTWLNRADSPKNS